MIQILLLLFTSLVFAGDFSGVDRLVEKAMREKTLPGAVLAIGQADEISEQSYGVSSSTVYDLASLSKVVATATAIMILEEQGKIKITDQVSDYYPEFHKNISIEDLLRHNAGLPASISVIPGEAYEDFIHRALKSKLQNVSVYSDLGFIILGDLVQKISGMSLHEFTQKFIYVPLRMHETTYFADNCAPTTAVPGCLPHDPKSRAHFPHSLGHAGIFSTARDVSRFAQMYLNEGELDGVRILQKKTVRKMTIIGGEQLRGLGWDLLSVYSNPPRGDFFSKGISYGHTGYTGTTLWIDPGTKSFYVFLSNRVYLGEDRTAKPFTELRRALSTEIGRIIYSSSSTQEILQ